MRECGHIFTLEGLSSPGIPPATNHDRKPSNHPLATLCKPAPENIPSLNHTYLGTMDALMSYSCYSFVSTPEEILRTCHHNHRTRTRWEKILHSLSKMFLVALISEQSIQIYAPTYTYLHTCIHVYDDFQVTLESHRAVHRYVVYKSRISVEYAPLTTNVLRIVSQYYTWCWHLIDILPIRMCVSYTDSIIYSWGQYATYISYSKSSLVHTRSYGLPDNLTIHSGHMQRLLYLVETDTLGNGRNVTKYRSIQAKKCMPTFLFKAQCSSKDHKYLHRTP